MPLYPYECQDCQKTFDVVKSVADIDMQESCTSCKSANTNRRIAKSNIEKSSFGEPYYCPSLGAIIKSKSHKKQIMKSLKVEEVGTTSTDQMHKDLDEQREKRIAARWDDI